MTKFIDHLAYIRVSWPWSNGRNLKLPWSNGQNWSILTNDQGQHGGCNGKFVLAINHGLSSGVSW